MKLCDFGSATTDVYSPNPSWSANQRNMLEENVSEFSDLFYWKWVSFSVCYLSFLLASYVIRIKKLCNSFNMVGATMLAIKFSILTY